jgi:hypothetical protein
MSRFSAKVARGRAAAAALVDEETLAPASGARKGKQITHPFVWQPKNFGKRAREGQLSDAVVEEVMETLGKLPPLLLIQILLLLKRSGSQNKLWLACEQDFVALLTELFETNELAEDEVTQLLESSPSWMVCVLAAHLGASNLPDQSKWVADLTVLQSSDPNLKPIPAAARDVPTLRCYSLCKFEPCTEDSIPMCYCGLPMSFKAGRKWGNGPPASPFWTCATGKCRYWMTTEAYNHVVTNMTSKHFATLPLTFCPVHPQSQIKFQLVGKDRVLKAKCAWYTRGEDEKYEGCTAEEPVFTELLSPYGPVFWPVLDLVK